MPATRGYFLDDSVPTNKEDPFAQAGLGPGLQEGSMHRWQTIGRPSRSEGYQPIVNDHFHSTNVRPTEVYVLLLA